MNISKLNSLLESFEAAWKSGDRPVLRDVLQLTEERQRSKLLYELLQIELAWRQQETPAPTSGEYTRQFPGLTDTIEAAFSDFKLKGMERRNDATIDSSSEQIEPTNGQEDTSPLTSYSTLIGDDQNATLEAAPNATLPSPAYQPFVSQPTNHSDDVFSCDGDVVSDGCAGESVEPANTEKNLGVFGDYELLEEIARGGMGIVFKARQFKLNRTVALKMILSGNLANQEEVKRFQIEAQATAILEHPGIVPVFEVGEIGGQHFYSMGFVDGESLQEKLRKGPATYLEAAQICNKVADAVAYAHQRGVVHRDLKPANVLLAAQGVVKVSDFGLAKQIGNDSDLTRTGMILGTPSFMSPEQAAGKINEVGPLSDVYSLGAILYCLLTGRPPFQAATPFETMVQVKSREPISPRKLNPSVPLDLETVCMKCLEKEPGKRYGTANEFASELARYMEGQPVMAKPVGELGKFVRWYRRHPAATAITAGGYMLFSAVLLSLWALFGIFCFLSGLHESPNPIRNVLELITVVIVVYGPMWVCGIYSLKCRPVALWTGMLLFGIQSAMALSVLFGFDFFAVADLDNDIYVVGMRMRLFGLLSILTLIGLATHVVAVTNSKRLPAMV